MGTCDIFQVGVGEYRRSIAHIDIHFTYTRLYATHCCQDRTWNGEGDNGEWLIAFRTIPPSSEAVPHEQSVDDMETVARSPTECVYVPLEG